MIHPLTVNELDQGEFPELDREPGVYGIDLALVRPGADPRIPAPKDARALLLVSFTLLAGPPAAESRFELEAMGLEQDGKERRHVWRLVPPPPRHENRRPFPPDTNPTPTPGALDRGLFWIDLSGPLAERTMRPGDTLTVRTAKAQATLALPSAPRR